MARTERESDSRRKEEKWQTCWCCRDQQRACRMAQASAEKLEHTKPAEKERVASVLQREQLTSTAEPPLPKGKKEQSRLSRVQIMREGSERGHGEVRVDSTEKEGRFQGGKGRHARRASLEQVEGSMSG